MGRPVKVAWAIGISLAVHVTFAWVLPVRRKVPQRDAPPEVTFEIVAHESRAETASEGAREERARIGALRPRRVGRVATRHEKVAGPEATEATEATVENVVASTEAAAGAIDAAPVERLDLSPRAVALRASETVERSCAALAPDAATRCADDEGGRARRANDRLTAALEVAAADGLRSNADAKPELARSTDGSYRFEGVGFVARIARDGEVSFDDRPVVQVAPIPIGGTFDLMDAIEGGLMGRELHASEKRWFLEGTKALRAELAERERARMRMLGRTDLEQELLRLARDTSRPMAARSCGHAPRLMA